MTRTARRVVKLGGSLLDWEPVWRAFSAWLDVQPPTVTVLVVGGGELAEAIRNLDHRYGLDPAAAHRWCVQGMQIQAEIAATLLKAPLVQDVNESACGLCVLNPWPFVIEHEPRAAPPHLPHDWSVTSDSIAARLAELTKADELVLLKSALPPAESIAAYAVAGYVDPYFPHVATRLPHVRCVNLRATPITEQTLQSGK